MRGNAAEDAVTQGFNHITTLYHGFHHKTVVGAAIVFHHNQILGHVHQAAGQITGVCGFQRGIGQTFARTVGGNKVLQYGEAFTEVGSNRGFDNRAVRLGHQTTHTGKLFNLGGRTTRT